MAKMKSLGQKEREERRGGWWFFHEYSLFLGERERDPTIYIQRVFMKT